MRVYYYVQDGETRLRHYDGRTIILHSAYFDVNRTSKKLDGIYKMPKKTPSLNLTPIFFNQLYGDIDEYLRVESELLNQDKKIYIPEIPRFSPTLHFLNLSIKY